MYTTSWLKYSYVREYNIYSKLETEHRTSLSLLGTTIESILLRIVVTALSSTEEMRITIRRSVDCTDLTTAQQEIAALSRAMC